MHLRLILVAALTAAPFGRVAAVAAEPPRTAAVLVAGARTTGPEADALAARVRAALADRPGLDLLPAEEEAFLYRSARPRSGRARASLERAQLDLQAADRALQAFDLPAMAKALERANRALEPWVGVSDAVELDRQRLELAVAHAHATRDEAQLSSALRQHAARHPRVAPPKNLWPPELVRRLEALEGERPSVLEVRTEPRAHVRVDGRELGLAPLRLGSLPPGGHRLVALAPDHWPAEAKLDAISGEVAVLSLRLAPKAASRLRGLSLEAEPPPALRRALGELAGGRLDFAVLVGPSADGTLGLRRVELSTRGSGASDTDLSLVRTDPSEAGLRAALAQLCAGLGRATPLERGPPAWAWVGAGAGLASAGAGVALRLMAVSTAREFEARAGALTQAEAYALRDRAEAHATGGAALLGVGLAALAGLGAWLLLDPAPEAPVPAPLVDAAPTGSAR